MSEGIRSAGTVHATLLQDGPKWVWSVIYIDRDGVIDIISMNHRNVEAAKSAAWEFAQAHGVSFVPTKWKGTRP